MKKSILGSLALIVFLSTVALATPASRTINYQGRLTDSNGNPVADGNYVISFRAYDDPNALIGAAKWSESITNVEVKNGYFNVRLGETNPLLSKTLDFNNQYWLGVQVGSDNEMSPRQPLNGVPMTLNYDVPIGSIIAWHKNLAPGAPALSSQWVECNGQTISDSESVFDGQIVPDLNGEGRFVRGANTSGTIQEDSMQGHIHAIFQKNVNSGTGRYNYTPDEQMNMTLPAGYEGATTFEAGTPITDGANGTPRTGTETRSKNMSVVWIMKIK